MSDTTWLDPDCDAAELAFVAEWLAEQFLTPPETDRVQAMRTLQGQVALHSIGEFVDQGRASDAICRCLAADTVANVTVALQRRHTALFTGIFRHRAISPYASVWDGTGRLYGPAVGRMRALMRNLDVHLDASCTEPADHLSIELVLLAEALREERADCLEALSVELRSWTGPFIAALTRVDGDGFYGSLARLLNGFLDKLPLDQTATLAKTAADQAASGRKDRL
ncbi:TorD/DmsD family molecular chaperone [Rhodovibrio salinarum]|uniref:Tat proofreading chaperone TorD n=1 Tax=Rhodovibrio salinarum TaxID=1087 RepID=A0A934QM64_9PROT|nr:molecular chaperone TorD family protein [Rhodovibrio salinarum]MBK1698934.1 hypothetical protein [Rhodovibrio salinarum]